MLKTLSIKNLRKESLVINKELTALNGALEWAEDNRPEYCEAIVSLYSWSANYDGLTPFRKLLDLVGYSAEHYGASLADWSNPSEALGYLELSYLAEALEEWAKRPLDCEAFISELLEVEGWVGL
jgi:hypothetical protein